MIKLYSSEMKNLKVAFLVNPISGGGRGREVYGLLPELMDSFGYDASEWRAEYTEIGKFDEQVVALAERTERLIAVGGDGTMNAVMAQLAGRPDLDVTIGLVPLGTGNDLARVLGIYGNFVGKGLANTLRKLVMARSVSFDVWRLPGNRMMAAYCSAGLDAEVASRWSDERVAGRIPVSSPLVNKLWYVLVFWRRRTHRLPEGSTIRWLGPGGTFRERSVAGMRTVLAGSIPSYAAGADPLSGARYDDGLLRLLFLRDIRSVLALNLLARCRLGAKLFKLLHPAEIAREAEIFVPAGEPVQVDGEVRTEDLSGTRLRIAYAGQLRLLALRG